MNDNPTGTPATPTDTPSESLSTTSTNYSRWMTDMAADIVDLKLHQLAIPGAHNSGVDKKGTWGLEEQFAACQIDTFPSQLAAGARYLDLRLEDKSYWKFIGNFAPQRVFVEAFFFTHGPDSFWFENPSAGRSLQYLITEVKRFTENNPGEIVIIDFYHFKKVMNDCLERALHHLTPIKHLLIPKSASDLTIGEIREKHPGRNIVLNFNHGEPEDWKPEWVQKNDLWRSFHRVWSNDYGERAIEKMVVNAMLSPPLNQYWVLSAAARGGNSPLLLRADHPIRRETFRAGRQNANIVMVDFIEKAETVASVTDKCIALNKLRKHDVEPPSTPKNLTARQVEGDNLQNTVEFNWDRADHGIGVRKYEVYEGNNLLFTANGIPYREKNLPLKNYIFKVRAVNTIDQYSCFSDPFTFIQDTTPPTIPENFKFSEVLFSSAKVQWSASYDAAGIAGYELSLDGDPVGFTTELKYTFTDLISDKKYKIELRAKDINGHHSEYAELTLLPRPALKNPRVLLTSYPHSEHYRGEIIWDLIDNALPNTHFYHRFRGYATSSIHTEGVPPSLKFGARFGEEMSFESKIRIMEGYAIRDESETFNYNFIFDPRSPEPITNLEISSRSSESTTITWTPQYSEGVENYAISIDERPPIRVPAPANNYIFHGLPLDRTFLVEVWTTSKFETCSTIEKLTIETLDDVAPDKPGVPTITNITNSGADISWTPASDNVAVTGYTITINNNPPISTAHTQHTLTELEEATLYVIDIRAFDAAGHLSPPASASFETKDATAPGKPGIPVITNISQNSATITWTPASDNVAVTGYTITVNNKPPISTAHTQHTLTELEEATQYAIEIKAFDAAGNSSTSASASFRTKARPTPPRELSYRNLTSASVKLSWLASSDDGWVVGYQVFRDGTSLRMVDSTTYDAYWLSPGRTYLFEVRTKDNEGYFSEPARLQVTTPEASTPPGPVQNLNLNTTNAPTLLWRPPATGAAIQYIVSKDDQQWRAIPGSPNPQCRIELPAAGENYLYEVRAGNMSDQFSEPVAIRIGFAPPHVLHLRDVTKTSFRLVWDAPLGAVGITGYQLTLDDAPPFIVAETQHIFTGLTRAGNYTVTVKTQNESGELSEPTWLDLYIQVNAPSAPQNFRYTQPADEAILEWDAPSEPVTKYRVTLVNPQGKEFNYHPSETTMRERLPSRTRYEVRIVANNDEGPSRPLISELTTK